MWHASQFVIVLLIKKTLFFCLQEQFFTCFKKHSGSTESVLLEVAHKKDWSTEVFRFLDICRWPIMEPVGDVTTENLNACWKLFDKSRGAHQCVFCRPPSGLVTNISCMWQHLTKYHHISPGMIRSLGRCKEDAEREESEVGEPTPSKKRTSIGSFPCGIDGCGFVADRKFTLQTHQTNSMHQGVKKFGCGLCANKFYSKARASYHERVVHAKRARFACEGCETRFTSKVYLRNHLRRKTFCTKKGAKRKVMCSVRRIKQKSRR